MAKASFTNLLQRAMPFLKFLLASKDLTIVAVLIAIMAIIIVPLPSGVLDLFLTVSLAIGALIIMISVFIEKPTDFTTYPTLILLITLFRLSLNIATTRMILSNGHEGPSAVSDLIASFGNFVVGGNYVIGIIIFTILVLINFMVVTNGSTRVAEVAARFTLDAMPGKQMAIDADLNAGLINDEQAKKRREEIVTEANFYGAMDGSSKFIKGDAIAGIIITLVNIIGGILIGVFYHDMSIADSAKTFTILTVGDGLVGQIPALLTSTATGIIITRASKSDQNFAQGSIDQLGKDYKVLLIVGAILLLFASVPGLPTSSLSFVGLAFLTTALLIKNSQDGSISRLFSKRLKSAKTFKPKQKPQNTQDLIKKPEKTPEEIKQEEEKNLENILKVEILELDLGYALLKLVDKTQKGDLIERIRTIRQKIASQYGFLMPQVRIRDNTQMNPNIYEIMLKGIKIGWFEIKPNSFMAMNSGIVVKEMEGEHVKEPSFDLDALWISTDKKAEALTNGYMIVDPAAIIATHLTELVKQYAEDMLTRQDVDKLLQSLKKDYPVVVDEALKNPNVTVGLIQRVLKALLHEKVPIKDMLTIIETISDLAEQTNDVDIIVEHVRSKLARTITSLYKTEDGVLKMVSIDSSSEQKMLSKLRDQNGKREFLLAPSDISYLVEETSNVAKEIVSRGVSPVVIIADPYLRKPLSEIYERFNLKVVVLSISEIDPNARFEILATIKLDELT